jgi:hypothetical protein
MFITTYRNQTHIVSRYWVILFSFRWGETVSELRPLTDLLFFPQLMMYEYGTLVEWWHWQGKIEKLGEKPVPLPLFPPQIPHGMTRARSRDSVVGGRRLTVWTMARPIPWLILVTLLPLLSIVPRYLRYEGLYCWQVCITSALSKFMCVTFYQYLDSMVLYIFLTPYSTIMELGSSVNIESDYRLGDRVSIPRGRKRFFL